jgi:hypothetical protein
VATEADKLSGKIVLKFPILFATEINRAISETKSTLAIDAEILLGDIFLFFVWGDLFCFGFEYNG